MKGRLSSSKQMETDKVIDANEESRLSGAYIRSLVKHLTSKDPLDGDNENVTENGECFSDDKNGKKQQRSQQQQPQQQSQPTQRKKQVRRRLHTSRPYQERLLNMAEARREIVTALKFHRASMKQQESVANNLDHQSLQEKKQKSHKINSLYPSIAATTTTTVTNSYSSLSCPPPPPYWPISTIVPPPPKSSYHDNQDFVLPSQTLGLNLNFQNFSNLDTNLYHKPMSMYSASSTSYTPSTSSVPGGKKQKEAVSNSSGGLHHAMDDEEMEEIRSLGEQHQTEWNDTVNLVTSARWCNFLKTMEIEADEYNGFHRFDQVMEFPQWLINSNESSCLEQNFDDHFSNAYFQDPVLPW